MAIVSDKIIFGDSLVGRTSLITLTDTTPYQLISDELFGDGKNNFIVSLAVQDNKNNVSWFRVYTIQGNSLYRSSMNSDIELFTIGDAPVIDISFTTVDIFYNHIVLSSTPSPSDVKIEFRVERLITSANVLINAE